MTLTILGSFYVLETQSCSVHYEVDVSWPDQLVRRRRCVQWPENHWYLHPKDDSNTVTYLNIVCCEI